MFCLKDFVHAPINNGYLHCGSTCLHNKVAVVAKMCVIFVLGVYTTYAELVSFNCYTQKNSSA